MNRNPFLWC